MRTQTLVDNEYWLRCPFCGDSQNDPHKSHFSVNLKTGQYHCHRCNQGGMMPTKFLLRLIDEAGLLRPVELRSRERAEVEEVLDRLEPGPNSIRPSSLERGHMRIYGGTWDVFKMYSLDLDYVVGLLLRSLHNKEAHVIGHRGLLLPSGFENHSDLRNPLHVVEGPYDVLDERTVGICGFLTRSRLSDLLSGHFVSLCPDGDAWQDNDKFRLFAYAVRGLMASARGPWPTCIEYLPRGLDPDEVPMSRRLLIQPKEFLRTAHEKHFL